MFESITFKFEADIRGNETFSECFRNVSSLFCGVIKASPMELLHLSVCVSGIPAVRPGSNWISNHYCPNSKHMFQVAERFASRGQRGGREGVGGGWWRGRKNKPDANGTGPSSVAQ